MADCRITCIKKTTGGGSHEHISHVGNTAGNWMWTREKTIRSIESGTNTFFVMDSFGKRSEVGVVYPKDGRQPFLRTYANGEWNDNLLSLNVCPMGLIDI